MERWGGGEDKEKNESKGVWGKGRRREMAREGGNNGEESKRGEKREKKEDQRGEGKRKSGNLFRPFFFEIFPVGGHNLICLKERKETKRGE